MNRQIGDRAVVLGASMAGLLAARVLADAYGQVTVIDRDELPEAADAPARRPPRPPPPRAGWRAGSRPWRSCSPGSPRSWSPHGAPAGDMLADARLYLSGHRLRQAHTGLVAAVRQPTAPGGPRAGPGAGAAQRARSWTAATSSGWPPRPMVAASPGRGCCAGPTAAPRSCSAPTWWSTPPAAARAPRRGWRRSATPGRRAEQVRIGLGYATRTYRLPPDALDGDLAILHRRDPAASADRGAPAARRRPVDADAGRHPG